MKISTPHLLSLGLKLVIVAFSLIQAANWSQIVDPSTASFITAGLGALAFVIHSVWGLNLPTVTVTGMPAIVEDTTKLKSHWAATVFAIGVFVTMLTIGGCSITTNGVPLVVGVTATAGPVTGSISTNGQTVTETATENLP